MGKVPGVESVSVSLLTNSMGVEGSASSEAIVKAEGLIRKTIYVKGFTLCEDKFVRVGDTVEAAVQE